MSNSAECLLYLLNLAETKGFLLYDDFIDATEEFDLSSSSIDEVSESLQLKGIIFYESVPEELNDYSDYSRVDYDAIYSEIIEKEPSLEELINQIRTTIPIQYGELSSLIVQSENGNSFARERLFLAHARLAIKIALSMTKSYSFDLIDAISAAFIGLMIGIDRFNSNSFSTLQGYTSRWIQQSIQRECNPIWIEYYFPMHYKEKMIPIYKDYKSFYEDDIWSWDELMDELCNKYGLSYEDVSKYLNSALQQEYGKISLESQVDEQFVEDNPLLQYQNSENRDLFIKDMIAKFLKQLKPREADVVKKRYGIDSREMTLEEIGTEYGLTRERIRQIETSAMRKLKKSAMRQLGGFDF